MAAKQSNNNDKILNWLRIISVTAGIVALIYTAILSVANKIVWQPEKDDLLSLIRDGEIARQDEKKAILLLIRENEMLRREENICRHMSESEQDYVICMEKFERERDIRLHRDKGL